MSKDEQEDVQSNYLEEDTESSKTKKFIKQIKQKSMRVQSKPPKRAESKGVKMSPDTITEPDMALTTLEILRFHTRAEGSSIKPTHFDQDGIMTYYNRLSRVEKEAFAQENAQNLDDLKSKVIRESKAALAEHREAQKALDEQKAMQKGQQDSEGTEPKSTEK